MNDGPRQDPAYRKSILFLKRPLNKWVNKFFAILLLLSNLAFAQDTPPPEPKKMDPVIVDVDPRCKNAVVWGFSLVLKKQNGQTHEQARKRLEYDYMYGSLSNAPPEVLAYMFDIVDLIHKENTTTVAEMTQTATSVNELCVQFMDTPRPEAKPLPIKT